METTLFASSDYYQHIYYNPPCPLLNARVVVLLPIIDLYSQYDGHSVDMMSQAIVHQRLHRTNVVLSHGRLKSSLTTTNASMMGMMMVLLMKAMEIHPKRR
jgi:hypothetical protein